MFAGLALVVDGSTVRFRSAETRDQPFLAAVYATTREEELAHAPWTPEQKRVFLSQQFAAQDHAYTANYPGAERWVITVDGVDSGRLYLHPRGGEIRIMDIALLPPARRRGIGTATLQQVLRRAAAASQRVSIHVECFNPARRLYERLGFKVVSAGPVYLLLERAPPPAT
ncbi:MAG: GNAT family N-acetyltransferase [Opitutaceae bacterium]